MRTPWTRSSERFIRRWLVITALPAANPETAFEKDWLGEHGGEYPWRAVAWTAGIGLGVPLAAFVLGWLILWAVAEFRE